MSRRTAPAPGPSPLTVDSIPLARGSVPVLGHAIPLLRNPLRFVSTLPELGPLARIHLGPHTAVMVCDPQLTRQVMLDDRTFDKGGPLYEQARQASSNSLATCPHRHHRRQRRLCQPSFHPQRIPGYAPQISAVAQELSQSWHNGQVIDVNAEMTTLVMRMTMETMFSLPAEAKQALLDDLATFSGGVLARMMTPPLLHRLPTPSNRRYQRAADRLRHSLGAMIATRRVDPADQLDLLSSLLTAVDPDSPDQARAFDDSEVIDQVVTFFIAGIETVAGTLAWALEFIARHPDIGARVHAEVDTVLAGRPPTPAHLPALRTTRHVISETLRLYPPAWLLTRGVAHDTDLGGHHLPAGTIVTLSPYLLHRRPDLYPDPDRFLPDRWHDIKPDHTTYVPFGAGARKCIGDQLALTEATLTLATIAAQWQLTPLADQPPQPAIGIAIRPRKVYLRALTRNPHGIGAAD